MTPKNNWLLLDVIDPREMTVLIVGDKARQGVPWRSVVTQNQQQLLDAVIECIRSKETVLVNVSRSRRIAALPVIERTHDRVHGVWVCTFPSTEPPTTPAPSWSFLWDLEAGFAMRSEAIGMSSSWIDLGVPTRRPIADALQAFDLSDHNATALAGLVRRSGTSVDRYTVVEHRPGSDRHVHFAVHSHLGSAPETSPRLLRGLSVDIGAVPPSICQSAPQLGDRIAQALTTGNQYRAISDPDSLNLLHWHGTPAPRIAWMADNTADAPILHPDDMPAAKRAVEDLRASNPGCSIDLTIRFLTLDGDYEPIELTISLIELETARAALLVVLTVP